MKISKSSKITKTTRKKVQAANFDADAFRQRHKAAQEKSKANREGKMDSIIMQIRESYDPIEEAFDLLVPGSGKADTKAGELVRAMMRILYRDYNDGDVFYEGYGIETCGDAVAFLCDQIPELEDKFEGIAMRTLTDNSYTKSITAIADEVLDYIYSNPELVIEKNDVDMFDYDGEDFIRDHDWEPKYDFECELPENVYAHLENEDISEQDFIWELQSWDYLRDADIRLGGWGGIEVNEIDRDTYDELNNSMYGWLEQYGDDLDSEFGVLGEDDELEGDEDDDIE